MIIKPTLLIKVNIGGIVDVHEIIWDVGRHPIKIGA